MATTTGVETPVTRNETPCPPWCTDSHEFHSMHRTVTAVEPEKRAHERGEVALVDIRSNVLGEHLYEVSVYAHGEHTAYVPFEQALHLADVLAATGGAKWMTEGMRAAAGLGWRLSAHSTEATDG